MLTNRQHVLFKFFPYDHRTLCEIDCPKLSGGENRFAYPANKKKKKFVYNRKKNEKLFILKFGRKLTWSRKIIATSRFLD